MKCSACQPDYCACDDFYKGRIEHWQAQAARDAEARPAFDGGQITETDMNNATPHQDQIMRFFEYKHLPDHLQTYSRPFGEMAQWICDTIPGSAERTVALRKLLEAKDAAVRAAL